MCKCPLHFCCTWSRKAVFLLSPTLLLLLATENTFSLQIYVSLSWEICCYFSGWKPYVLSCFPGGELPVHTISWLISSESWAINSTTRRGRMRHNYYPQGALRPPLSAKPLRFQLFIKKSLICYWRNRRKISSNSISNLWPKPQKVCCCFGTQEPCLVLPESRTHSWTLEVLTRLLGSLMCPTSTWPTAMCS